MDNLNENITTLEEILTKVKLVENFISLSLRREERRSDIKKLQQNAKEVDQTLIQAKRKMGELTKDYNNVMMRVQQVQLTFMDNVIAEKMRKLQEAREDERDIRGCTSRSAKKENVPTISSKTLLSSNSKLMVANMAQLSINRNCETPKMTIYAYKESPLVRRNRLNPITINFLEFEYQITAKVFETIPKYLRGREQLEELNSFLEQTIIECFNSKYQLMHRHRSVVRNPADKELWNMYNEQASYVSGHFITLGDISRKIGRIVDKKSQNRIIMLRHVGVLQEQRVKQTVCYIWSANAIL